MSSNLKVNTILPSTGTTIGIGTAGGLINVVGNIDVNSTSGISTFNGLEISGIVTAKAGAAVTYYGDGSNLTSLPAQATIANNADNRIITGGSGVNLNAESTLTYDGTFLLATSPNFVLKGIDTNASNSENYIQFNAGYISYDSDNGNATGNSGHYFNVDGSEKLRINASGQLIFNADTNTHIARPAADTFAFTTGGTERLRITSAGDTELRNDVAGINDSYSQYLKFRTTQSNGQSAITGAIRAQGKSNWGGDLVFYSKPANGSPNDTVTERLRITSTGEVGVNTTAPVEKLGISGDIRLVNPTGTTRRINAIPSGTYNTGTSGGSAICFQRTADGGGGSDEIFFETHWQGNRHGESMRINKYGHVTKPNHPSFRANRTVGSNHTSTTGEILPWNVLEWDRTNRSGYGYDTSTYKYRVAVAGVYWFHCSVYTDANTEVMFDIVKNTTGGFIQRAEHRQSNGDDIGNNSIVHCAGISQCAVGDYIFVYNSGGTAIELIGGHAEGYVDFSGFLIG